MAEMNDNAATGKASKRVPVRKSTRVDLTPMVDLGFLLITFFVFTTTMSKPTAMKVDLPYEKEGPTDLVCESCVLNVVLENDNEVKYYEGNDASHMQSTSYEGIRDVIVKKKHAVKAVRNQHDQMVLIIRPTSRASFKNFVDITDEVTINDVRRYYICDQE